MQFGIFTVDDLTARSTTGRTLPEHERIRTTAELTVSPGRMAAFATPSARCTSAERRPRPRAGAG
ncbi:hypothetical protein ACQPZQ_30920 [Pseudonocardia sp. CA-142604]|uniref:hypothetical protein n=1 Tax=Pseudonocardia sp. CA-142604 TaxID=3240024 RepID=UPI003D8E6012